MNEIISVDRFRHDGEYRTVILTVVSGIFLIISWFGGLKEILPFDPAWVSIIISGTPILRGAAKGLFTRFDIRAGVLVSMALIASVAIGEYFAAGEVAFIMMLGEILENATVRKARENIKKLIRLTPQTARIRTAHGEKEIAADQVKVGDRILVKPGESIPADGIIVNGQTAVNQSVMTGESMPVDKSVGDEVFVGTLNQLGVIEVEATKVGEDTSLAKLVRLVREAENKKAPVVRIADKMATVVVPVALLISILTYVLTKDVTRAVTILVVFCPCALVLATPTAIVAGIGNASRRGILVKSGEALEKIGKIDAVAFDKTGTITYGKPEVIDIVSVDRDYDEETVLQLASAAEKFSEHPLGKAVYGLARERSLDVADPQEFKIELGQGVTALIDDKRILVGNQKLMAAHPPIELTREQGKQVNAYESAGKAVLLVAVENAVIGLITVADKVKSKAEETVRRLKEMGLREILLLTGDNETTAASIAKRVGITAVYAEQLPEDKVRVIEDQLKNGKRICMIGDGINDAPALALADVSVAMGALGADIAIETADIALMSDDIGKIPALMALSKKVLGTITINIIISMMINFGAILLAALGIMGPVAGALVHNAGSVLVVVNSATLIKYRPEGHAS